MKVLILISLLLLSSAAFAGQKNNVTQNSTGVTKPKHQLTIDLDKLSRQTRNISLLQPVLAIVKIASHPASTSSLLKKENYVQLKLFGV